MNYKEKYMKLKAILLIEAGIALSIFGAGVFILWAISKGVIQIG